MSSAYTPQTLTLAGCRALDLDVVGYCGGCRSLRQWVPTRRSKHDETPIDALWGEGRFKCLNCGGGKLLDWVRVSLPGNLSQAGEVMALWERPADNVEGYYPIRQQVVDGRAELTVSLTASGPLPAALPPGPRPSPAGR